VRSCDEEPRTTRAVDLLVEGVPSPAKSRPRSPRGAGTAAFVFKTVADPYAAASNLFPRLTGTLSSDATLVNHRSRGKERVGALLALQGKEHEQAKEFGPATSGPSRS
jgi:elongation factor G